LDGAATGPGTVGSGQLAAFGTCAEGSRFDVPVLSSACESIAMHSIDGVRTLT
jgi:hypothetical protein